MAEPAVADEAKPAVAVANAVAPVAAAPATVAAAPANAVAVAIPAAGPHLPAKKWSSELCDCTNDCGICCVGCCCEFVAAPQLYERIIKAPGSCQKFGAILLALFVLTWVSSLLNQANVGPYLINTDWGGFLPIWGPVGNVVQLTFTVVVTWLLCTVRAKIREQDEIRADSCGDAEDCCCSFWCGPCVTVRPDPLLRRPIRRLSSHTRTLSLRPCAVSVDAT